MAAANSSDLAQSEIQVPFPDAPTTPRRRDPNGTRSAPLGRRLLRTREAAQYLSVSPWKLRKLVQDGLLPVVQASEGGAWRVDVRDLDSFIERNKRTEPVW
jgi:excisionase family DNA binding protein